VLRLLTVYRREDLVRALERAVRYRAFSWSAVERIVTTQARPRSAMESLTIEAQEHLNEILQEAPLAARSTAEYQPLLEETAHCREDETDDGENGDDSDEPTA